MGKVKYRIRLYRVHDLDLITFIETHEFNLTKGVYCALTAFSHSDFFIINIPPKREKNLEIKKRVYSKQLSLDEEKDAKAIEIMNKIAPGYRNNFLKNLLRQYLCTPISETFLNDELDSQFFYSKFEIFKTGKRRANSGKLHRSKYVSIEQSIENLFDDANRKDLHKGFDEQAEVTSVSEDIEGKRNINGVNKEKSYVEDAIEDSNEITHDDEQGALSSEEDLTDLFASLIG